MRTKPDLERDMNQQQQHLQLKKEEEWQKKKLNVKNQQVIDDGTQSFFWFDP